ncbi:MAG: endo alpha-1,4 polygalactosaminidase, partial [Demequina sp.]|uniref:endo alpha-1,4 polygalactosaminidase n=1 Tax=Demequina sp. TaxID=2050685 RepID=UPI003A8A2AA1
MLTKWARACAVAVVVAVVLAGCTGDASPSPSPSTAASETATPVATPSATPGALPSATPSPSASVSASGEAAVSPSPESSSRDGASTSSGSSGASSSSGKNATGGSDAGLSAGGGSAHGTGQGSGQDSAAPAVTLPPTTGTFDYQLGGTYDRLPSGATPAVVVRDATAAVLPGAYNVCYVNGFQTQPGEANIWKASPGLLLRDASGALVVDPDWPDEYILDPSTARQRERILAFMAPVIEGCADAGFDAVEIDNLDTWTRFDAIDADGAAALARAYVETAHAAGLAIAQKNAAEITRTAHEEWG